MDIDRVSIIIPTLNEGTQIQRTLNQLQKLDPQPWEIIVVDGGSIDDTVAIAQTYQVKVLVTETARRSLQMNRGAEVATGKILCFLHADTLLPDDAITLMRTTLQTPEIVGAGFISLMCGQQTTRWTVSIHNYLKTYYAPLIFRPYRFLTKGLRLLFGDQVIFCRHQDFWQCGGFDSELTIMEEADLCLKLNQLGRIYLVNRVVQSSDRRVAKWGVLKANLIYLYVGILWGLGVNHYYLKRFYKEVR